ncbi:MAG: FAD-dependent oxidoreductase, partial [Chloroflexi bacterium]|nr:FAD-dependent oxidoreductase [Chloroflexota bacterium]
MAETADVIVVGAGNAALCAALAAREGGRSVVAIEKAPEHLRGGNTYFTGGAIRFAYDGIDDVRQIVPDLSEAELAVLEVGSYTERAYFDDLMRVTEGLSDQEMADALVRGSFPTMRWLYDQGIRFVPSWSHQAFKDGEVYRFWGGLCLEAVGAGKGLSDQLFAVAQERGVEVRYDTAAVRLTTNDAGGVAGVVVRTPAGYEELSAKAVVLACGGFEANPEMRARYLGPGWELAKVRGVRFNTGEGIQMALDIGAQPFGHWSGCHAVAW